jgi:TonB-dependent receptor
MSTLDERALTERNFTDVLPSLALNLKPTERQSLRASLSRTLARPEYRELAALRTRDVLGGVDVRGNPELVRTLIDNADLRWEWYPNAGEILSLGVFAKRFDRPIERVFRPASSGSIVTFVNAEGADNYGAELEVRKGLGFLAERLSSLSAFTNLTVMHSEVRLGDAEGAATDKRRAMVGQAPYVVNAGLTYVGGDGRLSATLLYNRVGERIAEAGESRLPDVRERPRDVMDLSLRFPVLGAVTGRFDARNLLDAPYERLQGAVVRERYLAGRVFQAGLSWQR